ncbi:MAG: hypothetical protein ACI8Y3_001758, partial [Paraglaciecola sp.]
TQFEVDATEYASVTRLSSASTKVTLRTTGTYFKHTIDWCQ